MIFDILRKRRRVLVHKGSAIQWIDDGQQQEDQQRYRPFTVGMANDNNNNNKYYSTIDEWAKENLNA